MAMSKSSPRVSRFGRSPVQDGLTCAKVLVIFIGPLQPASELIQKSSELIITMTDRIAISGADEEFSSSLSAAEMEAEAGLSTFITSLWAFPSRTHSTLSQKLGWARYALESRDRK